MNRRTLIGWIGGTAALASLPTALALTENRAREGASSMLQDLHDNWRNYLPEGHVPPTADDALTLDKAQWRERLDDSLAFDVLRRESTERAFSSALNNEKREGVFLCAGCELPLFTSPMKFDSGTGWPSFFTSIPGAFETKRDFKLILPRTEYHCARCGGHHGHVFNDGPQPTGERWCNNGVALRFLPRA